MKKYVLLIFTLFLIPSLIYSVEFLIDVETSYTDPYPIEPGKNLVLDLQLTNKGSEEANDISVELKPSPPFTLLESSKKSVNNILAGESRIVEYDLFVDSSAVSAVYEISLSISYGTLQTLEKIVRVRVQGIPQFELLSATSTEINPGSQEKIIVMIENIGTGTAKRLTASFSSSSENIKPIFSGGNVYVGEVKPNEKQQIKFSILASPDAEYGVYSAYVNLTYEDESGNKLSNKYEIGVLVSGKPEIQIIKSEVKNNELSVEVVNTGTAKAIGLKGELILDNEISDVDYITQIKIDKHATFKFDLPKNKKTKGELRIYYKGPDNKEYSQIETITWAAPSNSRNMILIIVVLGVVVFFVWRIKPWKRFGKKK